MHRIVALEPALDRVPASRSSSIRPPAPVAASSRNIPSDNDLQQVGSLAADIRPPRRHTPNMPAIARDRAFITEVGCSMVRQLLGSDDLAGREAVRRRVEPECPQLRALRRTHRDEPVEMERPVGHVVSKDHCSSHGVVHRCALLIEYHEDRQATTIRPLLRACGPVNPRRSRRHAPYCFSPCTLGRPASPRFDAVRDRDARDDRVRRATSPGHCP